MRPLARKETDAVLSRLLPGNPDAMARVRETLFATGGNSRSLAAIYRAAGADKAGRQEPSVPDLSPNLAA
jgi:hypothetical protein